MGAVRYPVGGQGQPPAMSPNGCVLARRQARTFPLTHFSLARLLPMLDPTPFFTSDFFATKDVTLPRLQKFSLDAI